MSKMTLKGRLLFSACCLVTILPLLYSCDSMEEDSLPGNPNVTISGDEIYVLSNGTAYIDLYSKIQTNGKVILNISSKPAKGVLSQVGGGLLRYDPSPSFISGKDHFTFSVLSELNELIKSDSIVIVVGDTTHVPCGIYTADDSVYASSTPVEVDVLRNDFICGDSSDIVLEIYHKGSGLPPHFGSASVTSTNKVRYVSSHAVVEDTVVYKVSKASDRSVYGYGTLFIHINNECLPSLPEILAVDSAAYPVTDSLLIAVKPAGPICGIDYADSLSVEILPTKGQAIIGDNLLWYVYKLTSAQRMIRDSLTYRWCNQGNCIDGKVRININ